MKPIKKFAAIAVIIMLFTLTSAYAANKHAKYEIDFTYNNTTSELIGEVYLTTDVPLVAGSFGFYYDPKIRNDITFTLNNNWFTYDGRENHPMEDDTNYTAFSWLSVNPYGIDTDSKVLMGKVVIRNVKETTNEEGEPTLVGWNNRTFRKLDWMEDTTLSGTSFFTNETDGLCYNKEIWRALGEVPYEMALGLGSLRYVDYNLTDEDDAIAGETGYFQGFISIIDDSAALNYEQWIDIDYEINLNPYVLPDPPEKKTITGTFWSYNKNNEPSIKLYYTDDGMEYTDADYKESYEHEYFADGKVYTTYTVEGVRPGSYKLTVSKCEHLPYTLDRIILRESDASIMRNLGDKRGYLYCGDVDADGKIKLNDRAQLINRLNKRASAANSKYDLNGDGRITFHDLNILKIYYNKTYESAD